MKRICMAVLLLHTALATAQDGNGPCTSAAHGQFDFWIGSWNVFTPDGKPAGHNTITRILDGCVVFENWKSAGSAFAGQSFNTWDPVAQTWNQTWVDTSGATIYFSGTRVDNVMTLSGERSDSEGKLFDRMSYTINSDGTVRQHWQQSRDGKDWKTVFDGLYRKQQ